MRLKSWCGKRKGSFQKNWMLKKSLFFLTILLFLTSCGSMKSANIGSSGLDSGNIDSAQKSSDTEGNKSTKVGDRSRNEKGKSEKSYQLDQASNTLSLQLQKVGRNKAYSDLEDVASYVYKYGKLPDNYINKKTANSIGWSTKDAPEKIIGGDRFGNREGLLPDAYAPYREADIMAGYSKNRGSERLIFTEEGNNFYYTNDHYDHFYKVVFTRGTD